jgi:hypothetical protein
MSVLEKKKTVELQPLSKEEALKSIRQFRQAFDLTNVEVNRRHIQEILKRSGPISDAIMRV